MGYGRMLIPGTNVPPYMVACGRQPSFPSDLERFELGDALPTLPALSDHLKELMGYIRLASRLLREARERTLARSREALMSIKFTLSLSLVNVFGLGSASPFVARSAVTRFRRSSRYSTPRMWW